MLDIQESLIDLEKKTSEYLEGVRKKCDWKDPSDVSYYRKELTLQVRLLRLMRKHSDFICPSCGVRVENHRAWVITSTVCRCRSCYLTGGGEAQSKEEVEEMFSSVHYYHISPNALVEARSKFGRLSEFADYIGWERSYQYKLEAGIISYINEPNYLYLVKAFNNKGIYYEDVFTIDIKYNMECSMLRKFRIASKYSLNKFASLCGWSPAYQSSIEHKSTIVSSDKMELITYLLTT